MYNAYLIILWCMLFVLQDTVLGSSGQLGATAQLSVVVDYKYAAGHSSQQHMGDCRVLVDQLNKEVATPTTAQVSRRDCCY